MTYRFVTITRDDHIATVTFNRPEKLNTLSVDLMNEIVQVAREFREDDVSRVVIFSGSGNHFSCGVDLAGLDQGSDIMAASMVKKLRRLDLGSAMIRDIYEMNQ